MFALLYSQDLYLLQLDYHYSNVELKEDQLTAHLQ